MLVVLMVNKPLSYREIQRQQSQSATAGPGKTSGWRKTSGGPEVILIPAGAEVEEGDWLVDDTVIQICLGEEWPIGR